MMRRRGPSDEHVEEAILASQHRRAAARRADGAWQYVEDSLTASIGGGVWRQVQGEGDGCAERSL